MPSQVIVNYFTETGKVNVAWGVSVVQHKVFSATHYRSTPATSGSGAAVMVEGQKDSALNKLWKKAFYDAVIGATDRIW